MCCGRVTLYINREIEKLGNYNNVSRSHCGSVKIYILQYFWLFMFRSAASVLSMETDWNWIFATIGFLCLIALTGVCIYLVYKHRRQRYLGVLPERHYSFFSISGKILPPPSAVGPMVCSFNGHRVALFKPAIGDQISIYSSLDDVTKYWCKLIAAGTATTLKHGLNSDERRSRIPCHFSF